MGIPRLAAWWNRKKVLILCYHGVTGRRSRSPDDPDGMHIRAERFLAQMDHLQGRYRILGLQEVLAARAQGRPLPHYSAVVTFDDGFRNFFTQAAPLLTKRRIPATLFLVTRWIREDGTPPSPDTEGWSPSDEKRWLSWPEVEWIRNRWGFELGSHTCSHAPLTVLAPEAVERELVDSHREITSRFGEDGLCLAYPKGGYTDAIARQARESGYRCALTTEEGLDRENADLFALQRLLIGDDDRLPIFAARVSGLICALKRCRSVLGGGFKK